MDHTAEMHVCLFSLYTSFDCFNTQICIQTYFQEIYIFGFSHYCLCLDMAIWVTPQMKGGRKFDMICNMLIIFWCNLMTTFCLQQRLWTVLGLLLIQWTEWKTIILDIQGGKEYNKIGTWGSNCTVRIDDFELKCILEDTGRKTFIVER